MRHRQRLVVASFLLAATCATVHADTAAEVYEAIGLRTVDVLTGTTLQASVLPGPDDQVVSMTTYFTGRRTATEAVNVRLDVLVRRNGALVPVYTRDFGDERGAAVGEGDLQLVDLSADGLNDIVVSYRSFADPLIDRRLGEVIVHADGGFRTAWSGPLEYDATRAAREVPAERRDRFERELDYSKTLGSRGRSLVFQKTVLAVAGERLTPPKVVSESFPLRAGDD